MSAPPSRRSTTSFARVLLPGLHTVLVLLLAALGAVLLTGCDVPTSGPSFEAPTRIRAPLVFDKTFTLLGGPQSTHEPLVDTTTSTIDSLFTVRGATNRVVLDETVSDFDGGSIPGVFDDAEANLALDTVLTEPLARHPSLAEQSIDLQSSITNPPFESDPAEVDPVPILDDDGDSVVRRRLPDDQWLGPPKAPGIDAAGATVESATFTDATRHGGEKVNTVTLTLANNLRNRTLTDGAGGPPVVAIEDADGTLVAEQRASRPVPPRSSETVTLNLAGAQVSRAASYRLTIAGTNPNDPDGVTLQTSISALRYRRAVLSEVDELDVDASQSAVSIREQTETQVVGLRVRDGTPALTIRNDQRFPVVIDRLRVTNDEAALADLPASFPELVLETSGPRIEAKSTTTIPLDLAGAGITHTVDVTLTASVAPSERTITLAAGDAFGLSATGTLTIGTMHVRPNGERVKAQGTLPLPAEPVRFESGDFVELGAGALQITNLENELGIGLASLTLSFPGVRHAPYAPGDSLVLRYEGASTDADAYRFRRIEANTSDRDDPPVPLGDLRVVPDGTELRYHVQGRLPTSESVRTLALDDVVLARLSLRNLDFREVAAHVEPLAVNVTDDANGDGRLDVANPAEAEQATFDDLDGFVDRVDGLDLQGSTMTVSIHTNVPADTRLYAAFRGTNDDGAPVYLRGKNGRKVAPGDTMAQHFAVHGAPLDANRLLQLPLDGVPVGETRTRTTVLDGHNSTVDAFVSRLPTRAQFAGAALLLPGDERIHTRLPLRVDASLNVSIPLSFRSDFTIRDTVDADLSGLRDLTDPANDVTLETTRLLLDYANRIPLGVDVRLTVVDAAGSGVITFPGDGDALHVEGAPKTDAGTAASVSEGTLTIDLSEDELRSLGRGHTLRLELNVREPGDAPPARLRATDTITFDLRTDVEGTVAVGN